MIRLFLEQIAFDLGIAEIAQRDKVFRDFGLHVAGSAVQQRQRGVEMGGLAAHRTQLRYRIVMGQWFAELFAFQQRNLVGTDDQRIGIAVSDDKGFLLREAYRGVARRFSRQGCFIDIRCHGIKRELQPFQEIFTKRGAGGEYKHIIP